MLCMTTLILLISSKRCEEIITNKRAEVRFGNFGELVKFWMRKTESGAQNSMPALMLAVTRSHRIQQNLQCSSILEYII